METLEEVAMKMPLSDLLQQQGRESVAMKLISAADSEIHHQDCTKTTISLSCFKLSTKHSKDMNEGSFWQPPDFSDQQLRIKNTDSLVKTFFELHDIRSPPFLPFSLSS